MLVVAALVFLTALGGLAWLLRCAVTGSIRLGRGDRGICVRREDSQGTFWFMTSAIGLGLLFLAVASVFILSIGRGYQIHKYHELVVADGPKGTGAAGRQVVLRVLETGMQYFAVVDGPTRRTSFGGAEYVLRSVDAEVPLNFLHASDTMSLWDNVIYFDGRWFAFNFVSSSPYREDQFPRVEVVVFSDDTELDRFTIALPRSPCDFTAAWFQQNGESLLWQTERGEFWSCPLHVLAEPRELTRDEFDRISTSLIVLEHNPVWLEFTYQTKIQTWCD